MVKLEYRVSELPSRIIKKLTPPNTSVGASSQRLENDFSGQYIVYNGHEIRFSSEGEEKVEVSVKRYDRNPLNWNLDELEVTMNSPRRFSSTKPHLAEEYLGKLISDGGVEREKGKFNFRVLKKNLGNDEFFDAFFFSFKPILVHIYNTNMRK